MGAEENLMSSASKRKGSSYERELVNSAIAAGLVAERAYGSNGRALGQAETVDIMVSGCRVQAKRRKRLAGFLKPPEGADVAAFREDRGETYALLRWADFLDLLRAADGW